MIRTIHSDRPSGPGVTGSGIQDRHRHPAASNRPGTPNTQQILRDTTRTLQETNSPPSTIEPQLADPSIRAEDRARLASQRDGLQGWLKDAHARFNTDQRELNDRDTRL